ncbi:MAG: hypothetical protein AABX75_01790 [Nanoarchaeota archaeon]
MKAQYNTVYGMLIIALSIAILIGIFVFSDTIRSTATKNLGEKILDSVSDKMILSLVDMRILAEKTSPTLLESSVSIPKKVGEQNYFVRGENKTFVIRTTGSKSLIVQTNITNIWNVSIFGTAGSQSGKIDLKYNVSSSTVMIS